MAVLMSYKLGSRSAKSLARSMGIRRVRANGKFRNNYNHKVICWGSSVHPSFPTPQGIINNPDAVAITTNKIKTLQCLADAGVPTPIFFTDPMEAYQYQLENECVIFERHKLSGRSGQGIRVVQPGEELSTNAPLYTVHFPKVREYRVHATTRGVFDYSAKLTRRGQDADPYVYNYDNGRVFCRNGIELPEEVVNASVAAINALGLDFGALDVGVDDEGNAVIFECNSAPALEGTTLERYTAMLREML